MAITITEHNDQSITPDEVLDWAVQHIDPRDDAAMVAASSKLYSLRNNREFVRDALRDELRALASGHSSNRQHSPQLYIHGARAGRRGGFTIRSVIWSPPLTMDARSRALQDRAFSYSVFHDHNFALLTVGYLGAGYETVIYEYDPSSVVGSPGETVDLEYLETTTLAPGKILYFRPRRDIHLQRYPGELSISLNLIGECPGINCVPQFEFDVDARKIVGLLAENAVLRQILPLDIVALVGANDELLGLVERLAWTHPAEHVRSAAYRTLATVSPGDLEALCRPGLDDRSPLVRSAVASLLG